MSSPADAGEAPPRVPEDGPGNAVELRYLASSIWADLARAAGGLALSLVPLAAGGPPWPVSLGLLALAALFAVFLVQSWRRGRSLVRLSEDGVALLSGGGARQLAWRDLGHLRLRWFGPRRRGAGWLDLELRGSGSGERLSFTSGLAGFEQLLERAVLAADRNGVELEPVTRANLAEVRAVVRGPAGSWAPRG